MKIIFLLATLYCLTISVSAINTNPGNAAGDHKISPKSNDNTIVAYYPFNGNLNDVSGYDNHGVASGGAYLTADRFGNPNSAFAFNGIDGQIEIANSPSLASPVNGIAICGWIYINSWDNGFAPFLCKSVSADGPQYEILLNQTFIGFYTSNATINSTISYQFQLQRWYFIAVSWNGSVINTYVNNELIGSVATSGSLIPNNNSLTMGVNTPGVIEHLNGSIDDIRIFNRSINASEINSYFNEGLVTLVSPGNGTEPGYTISTLTPTCLWFSVRNATLYSLHLYKKIGNRYEFIYGNDNIPNTSFPIPSGLINNGSTYFWIVRAKIANNWIPFSQPNYFSTNIVAVTPTIFLSSSMINVGERVSISGIKFSINSGVQVRINSNNGSNLFLNVPTNSLGEFANPVLISEPGSYSVYCKDMLTGNFSNHKSFIASAPSNNSYFTLLSPEPVSQANTNDQILVKWNDKLDLEIPANDNPPGGNQRAYSYDIEKALSINGPWQVISSISGFDDKFKSVTLSKVVNIPNEGSCFLRVVDGLIPNRQTENAQLQISAATSVNFKVEYLWDYSYPRPSEPPIGVVADGTGRFYIKVSNPTTTIERVTFTLSDQNSNTETRILGKLKEATNISSYSDEANSADQITANGNEHPLNSFYCWYVAPDDFLDGTISENTQERKVNIHIEVEYSNGQIEQTTKPVIVQRPQLVLVYGLNGTTSTWNSFVKEPNLRKFTIHKLEIDNKGSFDLNAQNILFNADPNYSLPAYIKQYRMHHKIATNQVYYVGHSMGGSILRYAETIFPYNFSDRQNYRKGFVNKFISLDTPHKGSPLANMLVNFKPPAPLIEVSLALLLKDFYNWSFSDGLKVHPAFEDLRVNQHSFNQTIYKSHVFVGDFIPGPETFSQLAANAIWDSQFYKTLIDLLRLFFLDVKKPYDLLKRWDSHFSAVPAQDPIPNSFANSDIIVLVNSQLSGLSLTSDNVTYGPYYVHSSLFGSYAVVDVSAEKVSSLLDMSIYSNKWGPIPATTRTISDFRIAPSHVNIVADSSGIEIFQPELNSTLFIDSTFNLLFELEDTVNLKKIEIRYQDQLVEDTIPQFNYNFELGVSNNRLDTQKVYIFAYYFMGDSIKIVNKSVPVVVKSNDIPFDLESEDKFVYLVASQDYYLDMNLYFPNFISKVGTSGTKLKVTFENPSIFVYDDAEKKLSAMADGDTYIIVHYDNLADTIYFKIRGEEIVPVELTSFTGIQSGDKISLKWETQTETNNRGFEIERKAQNGKDFTKIGFIDGNGTTTKPRSYSFIDSPMEDDLYFYRVKQIDYDGSFTYTPTIQVDFHGVPENFALFQNFPNPFNPVTKIRYSIPNTSTVNIRIYNSLGEMVSQIVNEIQEANNYEIEFDGSGFASGVYFYSLEAYALEGGLRFQNTKKMIVLK